MNEMIESPNHKTTKVLEPELRFRGFTELWEEKILSDFIGSLDAGISVNSIDRSVIEQERGVLKTSCVTNGVFNSSENKAVVEHEELVRLKEPVSQNSIIISRMNTPALVGANAFVSHDIPNLYLPDRLWAAKTKENCCPKWIGFLISSSKIRAAFSARATGTSGSMKNITKSDVLTVPVIVPKKEEQQKIADFLNSVDKKIEQLTEKHRLLTQYKKGIMQQIFTQQIRFKDNNGNDYPEWEEKRLSELVKLVGGYAFNSTLFSDAGVPIIRISNIKTNFAIDLTDVVYYPNNLITASLAKYAVNTGDVLIAMSGATTGKVGRYNESRTSILNQRVGKFVSIKDTSDLGFIFQFLKTEYFQNEVLSNSPGGAQPNISGKDIERVKHSFPNFSEQQKIANFLTEIDQKINQAWSILEQTKAFKKGLLQKMFV